MLKTLKISDWRQFGNIEIDFHDRLTILTGANGAGKTTLLNILSRYIGWNPEFVSSYEPDEQGRSKYLNSLNRNSDTEIIVKGYSNWNKFGELILTNDKYIDLLVPKDITKGQYNIYIDNNLSKLVKGVYISSHRPCFPYKVIQSLPTAVVNRDEIFNRFRAFSEIYLYDKYRNSGEMSATGLIKETLASLAIFGEGNSTVEPNDDLKKIFDGYIKILKIVLPPKLGFNKISVDVPEVMLCTNTGNFPIDAISGGISSILEITWQIYMFADPLEPFVVLIDEPENHLHPELQKTFLGNLLHAFPNVQFVVATHNPLMISAVRESNVYVLNYNNEHKVFSALLDYTNRAGTSNAILREVLGIDSSIPLWAEEKLKIIIETFTKEPLSQTSLDKLRFGLQEIGLSDFIPGTIAQIYQRKND